MALPAYLRRALLLTGALNMLGAVSFLPTMSGVRNWAGLPEAPAFYLWLLSIWIGGFGVLYFRLGLSGKPDRSFLTIGALGKLSFALLLTAFWLKGEFPLTAAISGGADFVFGGIFVFYLLRTRHASANA